MICKVRLEEISVAIPKKFLWHCHIEINLNLKKTLPIAIPKISYCLVLLLGAFFPEIARITRLLSPPSASADSTWDINPFEFESHCIVHIVLFISYRIKSHHIKSNCIKSYQITSNHSKSYYIITNHIKSYHIKSYQIKTIKS